MGFWVDALAIRTGATSAHPTDPEYQGRRETLFVPPAVEMIDVHLNRCVEVSNLHVVLHADTGSRRSVLSCSIMLNPCMLSWGQPSYGQQPPQNACIQYTPHGACSTATTGIRPQRADPCKRPRFLHPKQVGLGLLQSVRAAESPAGDKACSSCLHAEGGFRNEEATGWRRISRPNREDARRMREERREMCNVRLASHRAERRAGCCAHRTPV